MTAEPAPIAVTLPEASTLAIPAAEVLQVPPEVASVKVVVVPTHKVVVPAIAATEGAALMVMEAVAVAEQPVPTV